MDGNKLINSAVLILTAMTSVIIGILFIVTNKLFFD